MPGSLGAGGDCDDFGALLRDCFNIPASQITKITGEAVTNEAFTKALTKIMLEDARSSDTVIFYYSGLSIQIPDFDGDEAGSSPDAAFICHDADLTDPKTCVSDDILGSLLSKSKAENRLIVLDTCHADGFADGYAELSPDKPVGGRTPDGTQSRTLRVLPSDLALTHVAAVVKSTVAAFSTVDGKTTQTPVLLGNVGLDEQIGTFFGKTPVR